MKKSKILIAVLAVLVTASAAGAEENIINFDGKERALVFAQLATQAQKITDVKTIEPEAVFIPARVFTAAEDAAMDRSIGSAIDYVQKHNKGVYLAEGFECLKRNGTSQEKYDFVYHAARSVYSFPEVCISRNKGICDWVADTVCSTITVVACAWVTSGDNPPITKKECHNESQEDCKEIKTWLYS